MKARKTFRKYLKIATSDVYHIALAGFIAGAVPFLLLRLFSLTFGDILAVMLVLAYFQLEPYASTLLIFGEVLLGFAGLILSLIYWYSSRSIKKPLGFAILFVLFTYFLCITLSIIFVILLGGWH